MVGWIESVRENIDNSECIKKCDRIPFILFKSGVQNAKREREINSNY